MLQVDLKESDEKIAQAVKDKISRHGNVVSIEIHRTPTTYALVTMASHAQTLELSGEFGGSTFGTSALIHLEQK